MSSGFVNIIKPTGMTSFEVVSKVKKIFGTKKVGHLGTLDPAASGVLPVAIGRATKFFDYFLNKQKEYVALVDFNRETNTLDSFGNITKTSTKTITEEMLQSVLPNFLGEIEQIPPKFSAIKVNGERAYDLARKNANFDIKPRKITIFSLKLVKNCENNKFLFKVFCSAGTYIRTLFSDIASEISTVSTTEAIIRTKSGNFQIENSVTLEELEKTKQMMSVENVFKNYKNMIVSGKLKTDLINGIRPEPGSFDVEEGEEFLINSDEGLLGLYKKEDGCIRKIVYLYEKA